MTCQCAGFDEADRTPRRFAVWAGMLGLLLVLVSVWAVPARAQDAGKGFLFGAPGGTFSIRTGYDHAMAGSDIFSFVTHQLTVNRNQFSSPTLDASLGFRLNDRVDATVGLGYARAVARSEFRDWLDNNNLPINQTTEFTRIPLTVNLKWYLKPKGQSIGHFAWVPASFVPYVGGGVGTMWYKFRQAGDFIDFQSTNVFTDTYRSSAWTPMVDAFVGSEWSLTPTMALDSQLRYSWATGPLSQDFSGFNRIDLSGVALTAGLTFRY